MYKNNMEQTLPNQNNLYSKNSFFQKNKYQVDIALISPMPEELEFVNKMIANCRYTNVKIEEFEFKIYDYKGIQLLIANTGIGTSFVSSALTLIHYNFHPSYVILTGSAGGIKKEIGIGEVVIAETAFEAEIQDAFELVKDTPFASCLINPLKKKAFPSMFKANHELMELISSLSTDKIKVYQGTVVTSNTFPAPQELFQKIKKFNPYCIDMETSAFYQTAWLLDMKVVAIRGISNVLNIDGIDENLAQSNLHASTNACGEVIYKLLDKLIELNLKSKNINTTTNDDELNIIINKLNLQPHPEGGMFVRMYQSSDHVKLQNDNRYNDEIRSAGTSIYYLLNRDDYSAWHKLKSDEIWHFYKGSPIKIYMIDESGTLTEAILGDPSKTNTVRFQITFKAGTWFAAENIDKSTFSLIGCTVSPGFEYKDFTLGDKENLTKKFPQHALVIEKFSASSNNNSSNKNQQDETSASLVISR